MTAAWSDWAEERRFRINAVKGSRKLLRAILQAQRRAAPKPRRNYARKPRAVICGNFEPHAGVARIQHHVAAYYGINPLSLLAASRKRFFAWPRQVTMFLAHEQGFSLPCIGRHFGKDHTTVLHACRSVAANSRLEDDVHKIRKLLVNIGDAPPFSLRAILDCGKEHSGNTQEERMAA